MADLMNRLLAALNAHDLDAFVGCFASDYRSEQPAHPGRAFEGRDKVRENWTSVFAGIPDFHAELLTRRPPRTMSRSENGAGGGRTPMERPLPCRASP